MSTIDPLTSILAPYRALPAAEVKLTWLDNTTGTKDLSYGDRLPALRGYQLPHDHSEVGGVHLGMALARYSFGPAMRRRFDVDPGFAMLPSVGVSFSTGQAKLLAAVPCRILGGVTGVHVDMMLLPELATGASLTIGVVLRPLGMVNFNDFVGSISESAFTFGHLKKMTSAFALNIAVKKRVTFTDLTRLGLSTQHRLVELCFFLMSDVTGTTLYHLTASTVLVSSVTTDVLPMQCSPDQSVSLAQVQAGQPLFTGLAGQAKARGNALHVSVTGATPGYIGAQTQESSPFRQNLLGAHQHTGQKLVQVDGTIRSDGALFPYSLFGQGYPQQAGDNASDEFENNLPCTGLEVSRSGVLGEEEVFFQEIPLAAGARTIRFQFALRPETTSPMNRLALRVHLCRSNVTPVVPAFGAVLNNAILAINGNGTVEANGFVVSTVVTQATPGYQGSGGAIGQWSQNNLLAQAPNGVRLENAWLVSQEIILTLSDALRETEFYTLRFAFLLYEDQSEATLDDAAGLVWSYAHAAE